MTDQHRNRLLFATTLMLLGLGLGSAQASSSPGEAVVIFGVGATAPALVIALLAYVWTVNDREDRARRGVGTTGWLQPPPRER
ncbi:hypothetical protein NQ166_07180 [Microbacterium sp. zg.Y1090]|uniref:hypothetical protein n=1 Tax=Microbacterium TaxID=33882 RepID=UPI00214B42E4|nr:MULTISPECIES: hypothetical protein [unclassified Microbacterium]MCR2811940.1 hypothetical protein [Microbacterium sp. zg.Y1084]MCR2818621.1 hypothetical protein [Microbacterium sp. zg.Y1090]MDL5486434.1 hypothetical protein [Microbacterium sp. zg-Y1211]WIM29620.1 hypothetical protein QNO26_06990 [Microbacterium sp. zg-Y1090]